MISYSHDSSAHKVRVLRLADRLVADGIDVILDQYAGVPPEGWPQWMEREVEAANFVLVVCTETYLRRFKGQEAPGTGRGVRWEGLLLSGEIYNGDSKNPKFIPVLMDQEQAKNIPTPLASTSRYLITDAKQYEELYRRLTNQPRVKKPVLGKLKSLPKREPQPMDFDAQSESEPKKKPWLVPHEPNPVFTGREAILKELRADLLKNGRQALSGLGGIGKTQIAVEYAFRHREDYSAVLWTFADTEQAISSGFSMMAWKLGLPEHESKEQAAVTEAVKNWLEQNDGWLLVFDNADTPELVKRFLPEQARGHILLTSRAHVFQNINIIQAREVDVLSPADSRQFLLKRTGQSGTPTVDELAKELGYLPLALEQAAAYIVESEASFQNYLTSFRKRRLELLKKQGPVMGKPKEQQKRTVETAWLLNFAEVEKFPASADLLRLSAFLAPDMIPLELLEKGAAHMGEALARTLASDDPLALDELLKPLTRYSLIRRNLETRSFSIHPLVQEVTRDGMDAIEQKCWAERTVRAVNAAFPGVEFEHWPECERLIPQALVCDRLIEKYEMQFPQAARLLNQAAYYLGERAQYLTAEPLYRRALGIRAKAMGAVHPDTAFSLNNLAELLRSQEKYEEAESLCRRALEIREKTLGVEHPDVAQSLNNLALLLDNLGRYEEAEPLYRRALSIWEKAQGAEHPDTAASLNNLALLLYKQGKYDEAEPLYARSLAIDEKALGPEHPGTATDLNNLAGLYSVQGKYEEAELLHRRALRIREKALGAEHPHVAQSLNNLVELYRVQGKYENAELLYRRVLAIYEKALGARHSNTATSLNNLALLLESQGKYEEAEPLHRRALEIREKALGAEHPDVAQSLNNLALLLKHQERYEEAERLYRRALDIDEKTLGPEHPSTAIDLNNLALLMDNQGKYEDAEPLYRRAFTISEKALGMKHPRTATCGQNLVIFLLEQGKEAEAEVLERRMKE